MHLEFYTRTGNRDIFATCGPHNPHKCEKIAQGKFYPTAICIGRQKIGHAHVQTRPAFLRRRYPIITAPTWTTAAAMAAGTGLNAHGRPMLPWPGRSGCPGFSGSAAPAQHPALLRLGGLSDGVAPNPCPQPCTPLTLPGNKRVAVGAPGARWGGGNISGPSLMPWVLVWVLPTAISLVI